MFDPDQLKLTDFLDVATLQEIQDSFAAVAGVKASIADASGVTITQPIPTKDFLKRQRAIAAAEEASDGPHRQGAEYVAPIVVDNHRLGTIRMASPATLAAIDESKLAPLAEKLGLDAKQMKNAAAQIMRMRPGRPAAIQFLHLLANAIARLCYQEYQLRQRINELTAVYSVTTILSDARSLDQVLKRTVEVVCEVMQTKAASIRLIDPEKDELVLKAVHNLSKQYLAKGPVRLTDNEIETQALSPAGFGYVANLWTDPRVQYKEEAHHEGIVSFASVGMRYKGKAVGVIHVYTAVEQTFSKFRIDLLKAVASQAAAAIENARLLEESLAAQVLERQVQVAAQVQQRMIPRSFPQVPGVDLAAVYVPSQELGGDFYDFIELPYNNLGMVVADVAGKGIPASLTMAAVRAALRAQVDNVYYISEAIRRVNNMICRDSSPEEFVTLFYGVLDERNRRFTYCNAGHPPGYILRGGEIIEMGNSHLVLGVDPNEKFGQSLIDLLPGDTMLLYTDGLTDAMNFQNETFGRPRLLEAFKAGGATADVVAQNILWSMRRFAGLTRRTDDVTMIVARITQ